MGIGVWELLLILSIVIVIFGTKKLKTLGGDLGGAIRSFRQAIKETEQDDKALTQQPTATSAPISVAETVDTK